jgi:hypothetical protein
MDDSDSRFERRTGERTRTHEASRRCGGISNRRKLLNEDYFETFVRFEAIKIELADKFHEFYYFAFKFHLQEIVQKQGHVFFNYSHLFEVHQQHSARATAGSSKFRGLPDR